MTRVLLLAALGLIGAAGTPSVEVSAPPPSSPGFLVQQGGSRRPVERAHDPDRGPPGRVAGDLQESQDSQDPGVLWTVGAPDEQHARSQPRRRRADHSCPHLLLEAPKTGPPSVAPATHC